MPFFSQHLQHRYELPDTLTSVPPLPPLSEQEEEELALGHRVQKQFEKGSSGSGFIICDVPAHPDKVYEALADFDRYVERVPTVRKCTLWETIVYGGGGDEGNVSVCVEDSLDGDDSDSGSSKDEIIRVVPAVNPHLQKSVTASFLVSRFHLNLNVTHHCYPSLVCS